MRLLAALATFALAFQIQAIPPSGQPPRDPGLQQTAEPAGTAVIRGRVLTGDSGMPVRGATVTLVPVPRVSPDSGASGGAAAGSAAASVQTQTAVVNGVTMQMSMNGVVISGRPKTATTDSGGVFEFKDVAAGTYRVRANPGMYAGQYLGVAYGAKKPDTPGMSDPGQPIDVADGQTIDKVTIALQRGSVIAGRVVDENGQPLVRVSVYSIFYQPGSSRGMRTGNSSPTDDLGQFRIFGLPPGDYVVAAEGRNNTFVPPNAPPETEEDRNGFLTTYYPGTPDESAAQRLRVGIGAEVPGIDLRMSTGRLFHVSGMVVDSQGHPLRASGTLGHRTTQPGPMNMYGFASDADGRFQMRGIAPGDYRLVVRQMPMGPRGQDPSAAPPEMAAMPLSINDDVDNILVRTTPGATITGQVVFESGPPAPQPNQPSPTIRVSATPGDPTDMFGGPPPRPAIVGQDLTFTMNGLMGAYMLRASTPGTTLKSVLLGGSDDITDTPHEFKDGEKVTIILTTHTSTVTGTVTDDKGAPATDASIMLFSDDKSNWRSNSIHTRRASTDPAGQFKMTGILPGRYFIIAAPRERLNVPSPDTTFFEQLAKDATTLVIDQDEQRTVDLKVAAGSGGGSQ